MHSGFLLLIDQVTYNHKVLTISILFFLYNRRKMRPIDYYTIV